MVKQYLGSTSLSFKSAVQDLAESNEKPSPPIKDSRKEKKSTEDFLSFDEDENEAAFEGADVGNVDGVGEDENNSESSDSSDEESNPPSQIKALVGFILCIGYFAYQFQVKPTPSRTKRTGGRAASKRVNASTSKKVFKLYSIVLSCIVDERTTAHEEQ